MTQEEFIKRHQFCITPTQARIMYNQCKAEGKLDEQGRWKTSGNPFNVKAHCDHPEDKFCGTDITPSALALMSNRGIIKDKGVSLAFAPVIDMPKPAEPQKPSEVLPKRFNTVNKVDNLQEAMDKISALAGK